jgi:hypothetical protein
LSEYVGVKYLFDLLFIGEGGTSDSMIMFSSCTVIDVQTTHSQKNGGFICFYSQGRFIIHDSTFTTCKTKLNGGVIYGNNIVIEIFNSTFNGI